MGSVRTPAKVAFPAAVLNVAVVLKVYFCRIMNIFRDTDALPGFRNAVVTLGSFDGVHRGHQRILRRVCRLAREYDGESVVVTFDRHPRQVLSPAEASLRLLTSTQEKLRYLAEYGIDHVVVIPFTVEFSQMSPREYVERFLIGRLKPRCIVVGYDHRFGRDRQGNFHLLQTYANEGHFDLVQIPKQEIDHIAVSSTKIRNALLSGDLQKGNLLLHHPYRIAGKVVKGRAVGRALGYPTANVEPQDPAKLIPAPGVYAAHVHVEHATFAAMLYIGTRPTFEKQDNISVEVHLLDFNQEIYGEELEIDLIEFIRNDRVMEGPEALRMQIRRDETEIRACLANYVRSRNIPSVAIVALNYNGRDILQKYLPSFLKVTHQKLDIIVVDNGSDDGSAAYVEDEFPDVQVIRLARNYGYAEGYNQALANLDYDYYALVNTDVELTPHWLSRILHVMETDNTIGACQPKVRADRERDRFEYAGACGGFIDMFGYPFCAGRILHTTEEDTGQYDHLKKISWATGAAFVVRSEVFHNAGGFDGSYFAHQEEIDLSWTMQRMGYHIAVVPEAVVYHLGGATLGYDSPGKVFLNFRNNLTTITKHLSLAWMLCVLIARLFLDLSAAAHFLIRRQPANALAVLRAYPAFWMRLPATLARRSKLQRMVRTTRVGPSQVQLYKGSILTDYYILGRKTYAEISANKHVQAQSSRNPVQ